MSSRAMRMALDWARLTIRENEAAALSDAQLLEAFLVARDEIAFAAIVRRHGAMVLGVCQRFLRNHHDAEDAFQAVFLIFMKRADSIRPRSQLANWLYGVAFKTACKTRSYLGKRRLREWSVARVPERALAENQEWGDFWLLLDQELNQLAPKYRAPLVLCDLEGKSRREAAHVLGVLDGTLSGRLARARRQLAARLSRRGVSLSGAAVAAALLNESASASLPVGLVAATTKTAFTLAWKGTLMASPASFGIVSITKGVMRSMFIAKLWQTSAVLVLSILAVGTGTGIMMVRGGNEGNEFGVRVQADDAPTTQQRGQADWSNEELAAYRRLHARTDQTEAQDAVYQARKAEWQARWKEYLAGRGTLGVLLQCSSEIRDAEIRLANERIERLAVHRAHVSRLLPILEINKKRFDAGKVATQDLAQATATYESAVSRLVSEQQAEKPEALIRKLADTREAKLRDELLEAATAALQACTDDYKAGRGSPIYIFAASKRLRDAQLRVASTSEARVKAYKAYFDRSKDLEESTRARFNAGQAASPELHETRYTRIEAELDLAEASAKLPPKSSRVR